MSNEQKMDIDYVSRLARVDLTENEREILADQLGAVLEHFEKLQSADVENVEAIAHPFPVYNVWDEDEATECFTPEQAVQNAKYTRDGQVMVPKVVGDA